MSLFFEDKQIPVGCHAHWSCWSVATGIAVGFRARLEQTVAGTDTQVHSTEDCCNRHGVEELEILHSQGVQQKAAISAERHEVEDARDVCRRHANPTYPTCSRKAHRSKVGKSCGHLSEWHVGTSAKVLPQLHELGRSSPHCELQQHASDPIG